MKPERIERLLEQYFEGTSSREEEAELRAYFGGDDIEATLLPYQPLFRYFADEGRRELSPGFEERLLAELNATQRARGRIRRLWPTLARVAAFIFLALSIWWIVPTFSPPVQQAGIDWSKYEPKSPEEAYRITRMALLKASGELNHGTKTAAKEVDRLHELGRFFKD